MDRPIPRRSAGDLPEGWYPFSGKPILPELEAKVLEDLGDSWTNRLSERLTSSSNRDPFALRTWPERLKEPAQWRAPKVVLVGGGADPFDGSLDTAYLRTLFDRMANSRKHYFVILTRRVDRAATFLHSVLLREGGKPAFKNIAIGTPEGSTSAEQARVALLEALPVRHRFAVGEACRETAGREASFSL